MVVEQARAEVSQHLESGSPVEIPLSQLKAGNSPRFAGVTLSHVAVLAQVEEHWPPILVSRSTGEIIDGMHRYQAALQMGRTTIKCTFFDGDAAEIFVESVRMNIHHGLPLSLREREEAALRVLEFYPNWSDRRIAGLCGLAGGTVQRLRRRSSAQTAQLNRREGHDGRVRRLDREELRRETANALRSRPTASLREIARIVGTSPATVRNVRTKLSAQSTSIGEQNEIASFRPTTERIDQDSNELSPRSLRPVDDWHGDSALQSMDSAAPFLEWFSRTAVVREALNQVGAVPLSRIYEVADEARRRARFWTDFAEELEGRVRGS